jgi:anti-sigma factor RsiW
MMTCAEVRSWLLDLCYGELPTATVGDVEKHIAGCLECQKARAAITGMGRLLDQAASPPQVNVDMGQLYREARRRQQTRRRRMRRAGALVGLAAAVLLLVFFKWEVRVDGHQVVIRWGTEPEAPAVPSPHPSMPAKSGPDITQVTAADLRLAGDLIHALAAEVESRDLQTQEAMRRLGARLDFLHAQAQARWEATERFVSALNTIQIGLSETGGQR